MNWTNNCNMKTVIKHNFSADFEYSPTKRVSERARARAQCAPKLHIENIYGVNGKEEDFEMNANNALDKWIQKKRKAANKQLLFQNEQHLEYGNMAYSGECLSFFLRFRFLLHTNRIQHLGRISFVFSENRKFWLLHVIFRAQER